MKKLIILLFVICQAIGVMAFDGNFEAKKNVIAGGYNFWMYTPGDYEADDHPLPLMIFLHGASLCGNNLDRVRRYGVLDAIERGKHIPMLVVAPQNPGGAWSPSKINDMLEWVMAHYRVDATRVYVLGMSLGGYGTMDFVGTYPEKVAAAMALCGGCSLKDVSRLGQVPLWIMHGTADRAVSIQQSKQVVSRLEQSGNDKLLRYFWVKGASHGALARLFYMQKTYDWLIGHSTKDNPRDADRSFTIDETDIRQSYQEMRALPGDYEKD
ncbi:carboxylesterase family protein [Prevotella sp.]|uniref:carboxylesterase family protein n=1 Tax=Prevotella sp. TaxID=59823 RepID=UPI002F953468